MLSGRGSPHNCYAAPATRGGDGGKWGPELSTATVSAWRPLACGLDIRRQTPE